MKPTLLIVDDEKTTREGLRAALEERYDVYIAEDAKAAMGLLESIIDAVETEVSKDDLNLSSSKRSMLIATLYGMFEESQKVDGEAVVRLVRLAR